MVNNKTIGRRAECHPEKEEDLYEKEGSLFFTAALYATEEVL